VSQAYADTIPAPRPRDGLVPVDVDAAVDGARMLVALHERVERQFDAYETAEGSPHAQWQALGAITRALATHVAVEDELLYPAVRAHTGRNDTEIDRQLQEERGFDAKVQVLMQVFRQHARDAESLLVPELRRRLDPAEREVLGRRLLERVGQLEGRPRRGW
jgi:hemerythrin superfamily protein